MTIEYFPMPHDGKKREIGSIATPDGPLRIVIVLTEMGVALQLLRPDEEQPFFDCYAEYAACERAGDSIKRPHIVAGNGESYVHFQDLDGPEDRGGVTILGIDSDLLPS